MCTAQVMIVPITDRSYEYAQQVWIEHKCGSEIIQNSVIDPSAVCAGEGLLCQECLLGNALSVLPHAHTAFHTGTPQVRSVVRKAGIYCDCDLSNNKMQKKVGERRGKSMWFLADSVHTFVLSFHTSGPRRPAVAVQLHPGPGGAGAARGHRQHQDEGQHCAWDAQVWGPASATLLDTSINLKLKTPSPLSLTPPQDFVSPPIENLVTVLKLFNPFHDPPSRL